jgi:hypothetical protein
VADLLAHLIESRAALIESHGASDEFLRCYALWSERLPG